MKGFSVAVGVHDESEEVRFDLERTLITGESCGEDGRGNKLLVVPLDVKSVKSISAAAVRIQEAFPGGIDCVVNNAAQHLDGFNYQVAQEMLDVNFFGAQNVIRRTVPARWPEALTGKWLPAKSGYKGMRSGGCIINVVCMSSLSVGGGVGGPLQTLEAKFASCSSETEIVMRLTEYLGHVEAGTHISAGWPSNPYLVSKVAFNQFMAS
jgi:NAD(P)-dependent dehydrogenase (short-subunit alcohol dehydrogenase family)